ncbi:circularly permuted type 2 ATP-grasp protein [Halobacillus kuroshimensis]|uniref:circularly permuted type 2 ATP-grasp protein n=1 Tax=Halobacillus kuroshimensis TaxID=302481 RepID=UPI00042185DF|nr:circularly permuted type 2 ATP-grasp protein [Halobacillus kuroshimensis]
MLTNYKTGVYFDEMMKEDGQPKNHYQWFYQLVHQFNERELMNKHETAQLNFLRQGITFTVYSHTGGTERTMPFDFVPIIIPRGDWEKIEKGMKQRMTALNHFLDDIYHEQRIVEAGVIPRDLIENNPYYYDKQIGGVRVPLNNHIFLAGVDLIRDEHGEYRVLEDNLRNPSGMSYVFQNRYVMRQVYPELFNQHSIETLEHQLSELHQSLITQVPLNAEPGKKPTAVLLTPGIYNSAYYDHVFLAQQMGIELVEGRDLVVKDDMVYMKTTRGLQRVDIIYRRIDDDFLDPEAFRPDSMLGVSGLLRAYKKGNVSILNGIGNGVADDKAMYVYVPDMIRFYLDEDPIIPNVETYFLSDPERLDYVLENIDQLVVKNVGASGGYDMLIGPQSDESEQEIFKKKIVEKPSQYIAQPTIKLSRAPAYQEGRFYPCHVDLRVFIMSGEQMNVLPGGLSRVALKEGSLVVNSSQGGGGKDTWILSESGDQHA